MFEEIQVALDWTADKAVEQLEANWKRFSTPLEDRPQPKKTQRQKKAEKKKDLYVSEDETDGAT